MKKIKIKTFVAMIVVLSLAVCLFACLPSRDNRAIVVNLENCDSHITQDDLKGSDGIISDLTSIKQNQSVFQKYNGNILIPERAEDNDVLAYQVIGFTQNGVALFPIYLFNKVDKNKVDYAELLKDGNALLSNKEKDSLILHNQYDNSNVISVDVCYCVYTKNLIGKLHLAATIKSKFALYNFPIDNPNFNYLVGRNETIVIPTSKYTFNSFNMTQITYNDSYLDSMSIVTNNNLASSSDIMYNTGIPYRGSFGYVLDDGTFVSYDDAGLTTLKFNSLSQQRNIGVSQVSSCGDWKAKDRYPDYWTYPLTVKRSGESNIIGRSSNKGKAYTGLCYSTFRVMKDRNDLIKIGFVIDELSLSAQAGEQSFNGGTEKYISLFLSCNLQFEDKCIAMDNGNREYGVSATCSYLVV